MSESAEADSKTEEATEKKIQDALEAGRTPVSRDIGAAAGIMALLMVLAFFASMRGGALAGALSLLLANAGSFRLNDDSDALQYLRVVGVEISTMLLPFLVVFAVAGLSASFVQGAPRIVVDRILPDLGRTSTLSGWARLFSLAATVELIKALAKIVVIGGALAIVASGDKFAYVDAMRSEPAALPALALTLVNHLVGIVAIAAGVIAGADFVWTRFKWRRDLRMTRQEIKEELKQSEGDPYVKARMRSLAMDRSRRRMIAAVPNASFVIANPPITPLLCDMSGSRAGRRWCSPRARISSRSRSAKSPRATACPFSSARSWRARCSIWSKWTG